MSSELDAPFTVANYLTVRLAEMGINDLFNVAGSYCGGLLLSLGSTESAVRAVLCTYELESGYAADAYSRLRGYGALCGTYGVGAFSLLNAIAGAFVERCALVVINGGPSEHQLDEELTHGILFLHSTGRLRTDYEVYRNVTVAAEIIRRVEDAPRQIDTALEACIALHRPVYLEVSQNLWNQECPAPRQPLKLPVSNTNAGALSEAIEEAVERLQRARQPIIWGGEEIARWGLHEEFEALVRTSGLPYTTTLPGKSIISERTPGFMGVYDGRFASKETRELVSQSDYVLAFGTAITDFIQDIVVKDYELMLLVAGGGVRLGFHTYTDISLRDFIVALTERIREIGYKAPPPPAGFSDRRADVILAGSADSNQAASLTFDTFFARMNSFVEDKIVIVDTSLALFASADFLMASRGAYICQAIWLSIGYSVGAAVGASCASGKRVVAFVGDAGFREGPQAISTLVQYKLPAIICVMSNEILGIEQFLMDARYYLTKEAKPDYINVLRPWDHRSLAHAFGLKGSRVETLEQLEAALGEAEQFSSEPYLLEVALDPKDLPSSVRDVLSRPAPKHVQKDLEYPLAPRQTRAS